MLTPKQPFSNRNRLQTVELPQRKLCCNNFAIGFLTMADIGFCVFNEIGTDSSLSDANQISVLYMLLFDLGPYKDPK